jgi:hypothetical protein
MLKLLAKDFLVTRIFWAPAVFSYAVFLWMSHEAGAAYLITGIIMTLFFAIAVLFIDDYFKTPPLYASLPLRRSTVVGARYLSAALITALSLGLFLAFTRFFIEVLGSRAAKLVGLLMLEPMILFLTAVILLSCLYLPFYFRFGSGKALIMFIAILTAAALMLTFLAQVLHPIAEGGASQASPEWGPVHSPIAFIGALIAKGEESLGPVFLLPALGVFLSLAVWISIRISIHYYQRRDL